MKKEDFSIDDFINQRSAKPKSNLLFWISVFSYCLVAAILILLASDKLNIKYSDSFIIGDSQISTSEVSDPTKNLININTANKDELLTLNKIGDTLAERIIDYRNQNGAFTNIEQTKNVNGIGDKIYSDIANRLCIDDNGNTSIEASSTPEKTTTAKAVTTTATVNKPKATKTVKKVTSTTTVTTDLTTSALQITFPLNLNTATKEELLCIPDMTKKFADEILSLREQIIYFSATEELWLIDGITAKEYNSILNYIYVDKS